MKNKGKFLVRYLAVLFSVGIFCGSAIAAEPTEATTVPVQHYQTTTAGFMLTEETGGTVKTMDVDGVRCYSLKDVAAVNGVDTSTWRWWFSDYYYSGSWQRPRYNIPVYHMTLDGKNYELNEERIIQTTDENFKVVADSENGFAMVDTHSDIYCSAEGIHAIFRYASIGEDGIRVLTFEESIGILKDSQLTAEEEEQFVLALWRLYNDYPEGYDLVLAEAQKFRVVDQATAQRVTNADSGTKVGGYVVWGSKTIRITEDSLNLDDPAELAAILVHEATHLVQYRKGDKSEVQPVLAQTKARLALGMNRETVKEKLEYLLGLPRYKSAATNALKWLENNVAWKVPISLLVA